jgi:Ca2+-binding EF-hand superfamily protein
VTEKLLSRDPLTDLRRAFKLFDVDGTGVINLRDLRRVAKELGESLGEEELCVTLLLLSSFFSFSPIYIFLATSLGVL